MTNDLFRDLLEGRVPMPVRDPFPFFRARYLLGTGLLPWQVEALKRMFTGVNQALDNMAMAERGALPIRPRGGYAIDWITTDDTEPADPRARALWAKEQQGHGPKDAPLRVRGRTTHYKEKG